MNDYSFIGIKTESQNYLFAYNECDRMDVFEEVNSLSKSKDSEINPADVLDTIKFLFKNTEGIKMEKKDFDYSAETDYEVLFDFLNIYGGDMEKLAVHSLWGKFCKLREEHNDVVEAHNYLIDKVHELELVISKLEA